MIQATSLQTGLGALLSLPMVFVLPQLAGESDGPVRKVRVTWGLFILLRSLGWDTYPVGFMPCCRAVQYRECECPLQRGYFTMLVLVGQWGSPFLCKQHLDLPVKRVQVCGASVPSCQPASQSTLACEGLCHETQLCRIHGASCNLGLQS